MSRRSCAARSPWSRCRSGLLNRLIGSTKPGPRRNAAPGGSAPRTWSYPLRFPLLPSLRCVNAGWACRPNGRSLGSPDIELLEFQPQKENLRISLQGQARNQQALTLFLEALARQAALKTVHLVHQEKVVRERMETVEFEIHASIAR